VALARALYVSAMLFYVSGSFLFLINREMCSCEVVLLPATLLVAGSPIKITASRVPRYNTMTLELRE
jgi:hypothetical protein